MKQILFGSTNKGKIGQFQFTADSFGFLVEIVSAYSKYPDLKSYNEDFNSCEEIVEKGSKELFDQINEPIIVEDSIFEVEALDGRPGLVAADYLKTKGLVGLLEEMKRVTNRRAKMISCVGYRDGDMFKLFKKVLEGEVSESIRYKEGEPIWVGPTFFPTGGGYSPIFILDIPGGKTLSELTAEECLQYGLREPNFKAMLEYIL